MDELRVKNPDGTWRKLNFTSTAPDAKDPLFGVKITTIADSTLTVSDNCVDWLERLRGVSAQNLAVSGSGFVAGGGNSYINKVSAISKETELIMVGIGFNDTRRGIPIGTPSDTGTKSLAGYVNDFITALVTAFPTTPVLFFSEGCTADRRPGDEIADQWNFVVGQICQLNCIPFYRQLYDGCVMKPWIAENKAKYWRDNAHPNALGGKIMAKYLAPVIEENIVP